MAMVRMLIIALALAAITHAQVGAGTRQYVRCACRASSRGFNWGTLEELKQALMDLDEKRRDLVEASFTDPDITRAYIERELLQHAADHWEHCINNYSHEECVNADTSLRIRASRRSTTFCNYNNNMKVDCSKVPMLASTDSDIIGGTAEVKYVPPAPPAPKPAAPKPKPEAPTSKPAASVPEPAPPASKPEPPASKPEPPASKPAPPASKPKPPTSKPDSPASKPVLVEPKPAPAKLPVVPESKPKVEADDDVEPTPLKTPIPGTTPASVPLPKPDDDDKTEKETSSKTAPDLEPAISNNENIQARRQAHEGCVAVEHLAGYRKQHRVDLVRPVLCGRGFCATPNHAVIIDGRWTSMKELCSNGWECVRSVKHVNNLDVFRNRRAYVGEVTITPYDIRFPRFGVWAVQMIERLYYDVIYDHFLGVLTTIVVITAHFLLRLDKA